MSKSVLRSHLERLTTRNSDVCSLASAIFTLACEVDDLSDPRDRVIAPAPIRALAERIMELTGDAMPRELREALDADTSAQS